jgi:hypothetical protein
MIDNTNSTKQDASQEYRECAGKGCQNIGVHYLKIVFLNKFGWFCASCRDSLIIDKLVDGSLCSSPTTTGQSFERPRQSTVGVVESTKGGTSDGSQQM